MKVLISAFEPFGAETINPAQRAVAALPDVVAGATICRCDVPVVFGTAIDVVTAAIDEQHPDAVVCVGQAGGRAGITPERVAINVDDAAIPDNAGQQPPGHPVVVDAPPAYFSTLPVKAMVRAITDTGLPASLSNSAGTFVCNHLMFGALHHLALAGSPARAGFIHVPFLPEQVIDRPGTPAMVASDITRGLEAAIRAIVECTEDLDVPAGSIA